MFKDCTTRSRDSLDPTKADESSSAHGYTIVYLYYLI